MPGGQFSHFRDKMSLARDTVGQFRDDPGHSGTVGKPTRVAAVVQHLGQRWTALQQHIVDELVK